MQQEMPAKSFLLLGCGTRKAWGFSDFAAGNETWLENPL